MLIISVESVAVKQGTPYVVVGVLVRQDHDLPPTTTSKPLMALNLSFSAKGVDVLQSADPLDGTVWPVGKSFAAQRLRDGYGLLGAGTWDPAGASTYGVLAWLKFDTSTLSKGLYPVDVNHIVDGVGTNTNLAADGQFFVPGYIAIF